MALTYNLPKLRTDADYPDPEVAGTWMRSGRLDDMAKSLDLSINETEIDALKSLPDPWARALLFNQALTTKDHIAKNDARKQWRGLLALLALRQFYSNSYILGVQTIDLSDSKVGNPRFRAVLRRLAPTDSLMLGLDWMRTGVITIREAGEDRFSIGRPSAVGLMVPNCLVAPARGARKIKMASVPWLRNGLDDPSSCSDVPGEQWVALAEYISNLLQRLQAGDMSLYRAEPICEELRLFGIECERQIRATGAQKYLPKYCGFSEALPNSFYDSLAAAPEPPEKVGGPVSECEIRLVHDNGLTAPDGKPDLGKVAGIILLDPDIANHTLGRRAQDVKLFRKYALGTVDQGGNRAALIQDAEREGYLVITADQIFTDKLVRLANQGRVEVHGPKWEGYLLPLSPLALFMVERNKLIQKLSIDDRGDRVEVSLTLELKSTDPQEKAPSHTVSRFYDKRTDVADESVPDDIILWPNVGTSNWSWNFMRYSFNSEYEMAPRFAASLRSLADSIAVRSKNNRDESIALMKALGSNDDLIFERMDSFFKGNTGELKATDGSLIAHRFRFTDLEDAVGEQHILAQGADFLFFGMKPEDGGDIVPAGCIMVPERRCPEGQGTMEVAVDFGTTNTVVYLKSGGKTERMVFKPRVERPISSRLAEEDQFAFDCVEFFPAAEVISPFPTVMHRRSFDLRGSSALQTAADSPYHGIADNIFFMPEVNDKFGFAVERQEKKQLAFDLKWSPESEIKRMVKRFLRQIILMSTVEAMERQITPGNIKWHFSYPQAWNGKQVGAFQSAVKDAWRDILEPSLGRTVRPENFIDFETEGAAALRYFIDGPEHAGRAGRLILMFDIGGGTTEIAIYHDQAIIWRSSFRIAGGDFFTRFLAQNIAIFDQFHDEGLSMRDVLSKFGGDQSLKHFVELYISQPSFNPAFNRSYAMFSDEPEGIGLMNSATVALAGLCYYVGLVLRNLLKRGLVNESHVDTLTLAFAGRGSSFFNHLGKASDENSVLRQVISMISDVVHAQLEGQDGATPNSWNQTNPRVRDLFSTHPKHEVAHGMLCGEAGASKKMPKELKTPLGEKVELLDCEPSNFSSEQFVEDIPVGARLKEVGDDEFNRFLDLLAIRTGLKIRLDSKSGAARDEISNIVDREFVRALGALEQTSEDQLGETLEIEPPFITKLRSLVHIMARNIEERQNMMTVVNGDPKW